MHSRSIYVALILSALCIAGPARAQPDNPPEIPADLQTGGLRLEPSFPRGAAVLWLNVVREGRSHMRAFSADALNLNPAIHVDGYVNGVILLSTDPLDVTVEHAPMTPIRTDAGGYFKLAHYGYLSPEAFWSTFSSPRNENSHGDSIRGRYSIFTRVPGGAISTRAAFPVVITRNGATQQITIFQDKPVRLVCPASASNDPRAAPAFYYLGNDPGRLKSTAEGYENRMQSFLAGILRAERQWQLDLVDQVYIISYCGPRNAYTCDGENRIWLYDDLFWNETPAELQSIAEHEAMHILSDRLGLPSSSRIRELFAGFMGFGTFSVERFYVVTTGRLPGKSDVPSNRIFDFINEYNFIRGMNGGHSRDNVDEFCASFLHTLLHIDRLKQMLNQPVKSRDGAFQTLSDPEKEILLRDYRRVLETFIAAIQESTDHYPGLAQRLQDCLATADMVIPTAISMAPVAKDSPDPGPKGGLQQPESGPDPIEMTVPVQ